MKRKFARNTAISAGAHALVVVSFLLLSLSPFRSRRPAFEITTFIDFQTISPEHPEVFEPQPEPARLVPSTPDKQIKVSRQLISRDVSQASARLTAQDIRRGLLETESLESRDASQDDFRRYMAEVHAVMYAAWRQPKALAGRGGLAARALIRVRRDGRIIHRELIGSSGNEIMDASVMQALETVQQLPPLPPSRGEREEITIGFELDMP